MPCLEQPHDDPRFRLETVAYASSDAPWVVDLLLELARYPFVHGSGLSIGHTVPVNAPGQNPWCGYLLARPVWEPEGFNPLAIDIGLGDDWVFFAQPIGLLDDELKLAIEIGGPAFGKQLGFAPGAEPSIASRTLLDLRRGSLL